MKIKAIKQRVSVLLVFILVITLASCGGQNRSTNTDIGDKYLDEETYLNAIIGLDDVYVIEYAKNVDYLQNVSFDKTVIKDISVNADNVDNSATGEYTVVYDVVPVEGDAFSIEKKVTVVDEARAKELAASGVVVLGSDGAVWQDPYEALSEEEKALLEKLVATVKAKDYAGAFSMQQGSAYGNLVNKLPQKNERNGIEYIKGDTFISFFKSDGEAEGTNHIDIFIGRGGNGTFIASVYAPSYYYMNIVSYSGGAPNGPLLSYNNGSGEWMKSTGTLKNGVPVGQITGQIGSQPSFEYDGTEGFTHWPGWPDF